jgi:hypothetical protein
LAQSVLARQASAVQDLLNLAKSAGSQVIAPLFGHLPSERNHETKPVLDVSQFGFTHQPPPIEIAIFGYEPGQSLDHANLHLFRSDRAKKDHGRIPLAAAAQMAEPGITQPTECRSQGRGIPRTGTFGIDGQSDRTHTVHLRNL